MEKQEKINLSLAVIAIAMSLISISYTIYNDYKIRKLSFDNSGLQNRPLLKFEDKLNKIHYKLQSKGSITAEDLYLKKISKIDMTLTVDPELEVTNKGNSVAKILLEAVTDKYSGLPEIRRKLFDGKERESFLIKLTDTYYKTIDILPGKKHLIRLPHTLNDVNLDLSEFTLHYLIIYANEIGNIYDSYFWVRFKMEPIQAKYSSDGNNFKLQLGKEELDGAIHVVDTHFSTYMYSGDESKRVFKFTERYQDILQKENTPKIK